MEGRAPTRTGRPCSSPKPDAAAERSTASSTTPAWKKADATGVPPARRLARPSSTTPRRPRLLADKDNLYIAFECKEADMAKLVSREATATATSGPTTRSRSSASPAPKPTNNYFHLIINPDGSFYDAKDKDNRGWNCEAKVAAAKRPAGWTVEIAIPFAAVQDKAKPRPSGG